MHRIRNFVFALAWLAFSALAVASPYHGVVTFGGLPLPGATITATQGTKKLTAVSDQNGAFAFDDLPDGKWTINVTMQCFEPMHADITVAPKLPAAAWEMKLQPVKQLMAHAQAATPAVQIASAPEAEQTKKPKAKQSGPNNVVAIPKAPEENEQAADGVLVQGSVNNAATSVYSTNPGFGNAHPGGRGLYTGGFAATVENSALDARPYSLAGVQTAKPTYSDFTGVAVLQGPLRIPRLMPVGPNFFVQYKWARSTSSQFYPGIVPTQAERNGNLAGLTNAGQPVTVYEPGTNTPYPGNQVPVSPQAAALLKLYPLPNLTSGTIYNYQAPFASDTHQDALNSRVDKRFGRKDYVYGRFGFQSTRADSVNLFSFIDRTNTLGINGNINWQRSLKPRMFLYTSYTFSRLRTQVTPNFENQLNVSGNAGITGNDQDPTNWGPPALNFTSGFSALSDGKSAFDRNRTDDFTASTLIYRSRHSFTIGGEFRKQEYNWDFQENPRGTFTFTGAATGSDLADFLIGVPDTSQIAYGNANKYFREPVYAAYFNDDWRVLPILSINWGVRWDYGAPMTELFGNLVNLDVANGFTAVAPVLASNPVGSLTGQHYPSSLIRPDRTMIEPKIGIAWRPIPASTIVVRAGYGIYPDTSVYQNIILSMAQQAPLSKSLSVQNSSACPLTLANGFLPCSAVTSQTYGIDPNFRVGYAQEWKLEVQRDLPFAMQGTATYLGTKGTHGPQVFFPNSYPLGEANPCPSCPSGFEYETSGGNSIRNAVEIELRRRLRAGFLASLNYTYAKAIDDDSYLGGQGHTTGSSTQTASNLAMPSASVAQNWRDLRAERSLSSFDQRNLLSVKAQYTSGQGLEGGTLLGGWRGRALKEWTILGTLTYGSGNPETPLYPAAVPGTGQNYIIRPSLTGAPLYASGNAHYNAAAFTAPAAGQWGTAGRDSLTGPGQFSFNSSLARVFRTSGKTNLDVEIISTNPLNHATYTNWYSNINSATFGTPSSTNAMRSLQIEMFWRFQ